MLAIIEKWKPFTHGYSIPPDNERSIQIMQNLDMILIRWDMNDIDHEYAGSIDFLNDYIDTIRFLPDPNQPHFQRDFNISVLKGKFKYQEREFAIINYSFLNFIKKCKKYYKNKLIHYKNIKNLLYRQVHGCLPPPLV